MSGKGTTKLTDAAGLNYNVNYVRSNIKTYFENHGFDTPKFAKGHVAISAVLERMCNILAKAIVDHSVKNKAGMREVHARTVQYAIHTNEDLREYFLSRISKFDKEITYSDGFPVNRANIIETINNVDDKMNFTEGATNLLFYLLSKVYRNILTTCKNLLEFSKKKKIDERVVNYSINILLPETIANELTTEVSRAVKAVKSEDDDEAEDSGDHDVEDDAEEDDSEEEVEEKGTKGKKKNTPKKTKKKVTVIDDEFDDDDDDDDDHDDLDDNDDSDDEDVKPVPKKKKAVAKKNVKKKKATKSK